MSDDEVQDVGSSATEPEDSAELLDAKRLNTVVYAMVGCLGLFCIGLTFRLISPDPRQILTHYRSYLVCNGAVAVASALILLWLQSVLSKEKWRRKLDEALVEGTELIDQLASSRLTLWIAIAAGLGIFAELIVIRTQASILTMFAHFKNLSLMSCFLGLGIGYALPSKSKLTMPVFMPLLAAQVALLVVFRDLNVTRYLEHPIREEIRMGLTDALNVSDMVAYYGYIGFFFLLNAFCFVPLGQLASHLMARMPKLQSYNWNLIGSLAGILVVTLLSFLWTPPIVWFTIMVAAVAPFLYKQKSQFKPTLLAVCVLFLAVALPQRFFQMEVYSPYQLLSVIVDHEYPTLECNGTWLQHILDLTPDKVKNKPELQRWAPYYEMPYLFKATPEDVLIVGAGSGNDVASAVRHGAVNIDAVEIDPGIVALGTQMHPEYPYQQPNVHAHVNDARNFIKYTDKKYDLIIYGLLDDSHVMSATSGGMRSDSYVYTYEACREARSHLKPGGLICMTVCTQPRMGAKIYKMLERAFDGKPPVAYWTQYDEGHCFIAGEVVPPPSAVPPFDDITERCKSESVSADLCTDDWPFIWSFKKVYPYSYCMIILALLALSAVMIRKLTPVRTNAKFSWPCFFLGAGFMLVETKGITELALYFGSTWFVTTIVIAAILLLALAANLVVIKIKRPYPLLSYSLLAASIVLGMNLSHQSFGDPLTDRLIMTLIATAPLFFSGFAFSSELAQAESVGAAMYANLLGGMLGGFLEYNSMYFGLSALYVFALVLYGLAFVTGRFGEVAAAPAPSVETPEAAPEGAS